MGSKMIIHDTFPILKMLLLEVTQYRVSQKREGWGEGGSETCTSYKWFKDLRYINYLSLMKIRERSLAQITTIKTLKHPVMPETQ